MSIWNSFCDAGGRTIANTKDVINWECHFHPIVEGVAASLLLLSLDPGFFKQLFQTKIKQNFQDESDTLIFNCNFFSRNRYYFFKLKS